MRKSKRWGWLILTVCMAFLLSACQKESFKEVDVTVHEVEKMIEDKESFKLLVERENCPFCEQLNAYIDTSKGDHPMQIYRLDSTDFEFAKENEDDETLISNTEEGKAFLNLFPYFLYTPTIYTIEDGLVKEAAIGFNGEHETMSEWNVDSSIDWDAAKEVGVWDYLER